jgi:hypothetical protein
MGQLIKAYLDEADDFKAVKTTAILNRLKVIGDLSGKQLDINLILESAKKDL